MMRSEQKTLPRRSRGLLALTAFMAVFQAGAALRVFQIPVAFGAQISLFLPLEFAAGVLWASLAGMVFVRLWQRRPNARKQALWLVIAFSIYSLVRLVVFAQADYDRGRLGFLTLLIILLLVVIGIRSFLFTRKHATEMIQP